MPFNMLLACLIANACIASTALAAGPIVLSAGVPSNAPAPIPESFVSFSIEFSSFPDFAGNGSHPNTFSSNLLSNLGSIQGTNPVIRVGGNTQDYALYNASQTTALIGIIDPARSKDYPTTITIGPAYFESYSTWPNTTFTHGFNLANNGTRGHDTLVATAALACKALENGKLAFWELGNEPDLYKTSSQGPVRPAWWTEQDYVNEWVNKTRIMRRSMMQACPQLVQSGQFKFVAPSFGGTTNSLAPITTWKDGLDVDGDIALISGHNYISGATSPGVTLQGTLMNHTSTVQSVTKQLANWTQVVALSSSDANGPLPFIFGETNSLYNEGAPGLSNSFGAALWGVDFNLFCASNNVRRTHMHQGTNYRYAAWQPIQTDLQSIGTKAPYYGSITVASFLGDLSTHNVTITEIPMTSIYDAVYAAYVDGALARIAVIQLNQFNATTQTYTTPSGSMASGSRPTETFTFQLPQTYITNKTVSVQRLMANGSDAITGITFAGYSYNYELDNGMPVLQSNVTQNETVGVGNDGLVVLEVPFSSAAIMSFI